jgi:hypothetical protein
VYRVNICQAFRIQNCVKYGGYFNATAFQFVSKYNMKKVHQNEGGLELSGTRHLLVADYVNITWQHKYHKHKQQIY